MAIRLLYQLLRMTDSFVVYNLVRLADNHNLLFIDKDGGIRLVYN